MCARYVQQRFGNTSWNKLKTGSTTNRTTTTQCITLAQNTQPYTGTMMLSMLTNCMADTLLCTFLNMTEYRTPPLGLSTGTTACAITDADAAEGFEDSQSNHAKHAWKPEH